MTIKRLFTIIFVLAGFVVRAQVYTPMNAAGYQYKRGMFDSTLHIPSFCGVPVLRDVATRKAAIAYDSCNHKFWMYDPQRLAWDTITSSADITTIINNITLDSIIEGGSNLYFTTERARESISADSPVIYDPLLGIISVDTVSAHGLATKHDLEGIDTAVISVTGYMSGDSSILLIEKKGGATNRIYLVAPAPPPHTHSASDIISGILPIVRGGTALGTIGTAGQSLRVASGGTALEYYTPTAGNSGTVTNVTASAPLSITGISSITPNVTISQSSGSTNGYLSSTDWNTFNNKQAAGSYLTSETDPLSFHLTDTAAKFSPLRSAINANTASILLKLNISDTANKWVSDVTKINDSTIRVFKGSGSTDLLIRGNGSGGGGIAMVKQVHASGASVTVASATTWLIDKSAANVTITLAPSPVDGQRVDISFKLAVTSVTVSANAGQTIKDAGGLSSVEAGESIAYQYDSTDLIWYRL